MRLFFYFFGFTFLFPSAISAQNKQLKAESFYEEALNAYRNRDLTNALQLAEKSTRANATSKNSHLTGMIFELMDKDLRAIAAYEMALKLNPDLSEARYSKAILYLKNDAPEEALKDLNLLINGGAIRQTNSVFFEIDDVGGRQNKLMTLTNMQARMYYYRAQTFEKLVKYEESLNDYNKALSMDTAADFLVSRALLHSKMGNIISATNDLKWAIQVEPEHELAWYNLALLNPEARIPEELLGEEGFSPLLGLLATRAMEAEDYRMATKYLNISINNDPSDALAYINRGRSLLKMHQYQMARKDFQKVLSISPDRPEVLYLIGNSYFFEKLYEKAIIYYDQYLLVDPANAMVWYNGGIGKIELDLREDACHYFLQAKKHGMQMSQKMIDKFCE